MTARSIFDEDSTHNLPSARIIKVAMQGILCYPRSPRNVLIMGSRLMHGHVSVTCERFLNFWVIVAFDRLHTAVTVKPNKNVNTSDIFYVL